MLAAIRLADAAGEPLLLLLAAGEPTAVALALAAGEPTAVALALAAGGPPCQAAAPWWRWSWPSTYGPGTSA